MRPTLQSVVRALAPPLVLDAVRRMLGAGVRSYPDWSDAVRACTPGAYSNRKLARLVAGKTEAYGASLASGDFELGASGAQTVTAIGMVIAQDRAPVFTVIDFGGACGAHYLLAKAAFPGIRFDWRVVETPEMAGAAMRLQSAELHFFTTLADAARGIERITLVHSSGTLQCLPDPYAALEALLALQSRYQLFSRLGLAAGAHDVIAVRRHRMSENGPGPAPAGFVDEPCAYPFRFPSRARFEAQLRAACEVLWHATDRTGAFDAGGNPIEGMSYFCRCRQPG